MSSENKRAVLCVTEEGGRLANKIGKKFEADVLCMRRLALEGALSFETFSEMVAFAFLRYEAVVFIMATGIVVRSIAPHIKDKYSDPAVVVIDELGHHVISLLSGHMGGANQLSQEIAEYIGACPVITTATDIHGHGAFELYLKERGIEPEPYRKLSKAVNLALIEGRPIRIIDEEGALPVLNGGIKGRLSELETYEIGQTIYIGSQLNAQLLKYCMAVIPTKNIVVGLGFKKGKSKEELAETLLTFLEEAELNPQAICCFATIGLKAQEEGLRALSAQWDVPVMVIEESAIQKIQQRFEASDWVQKTVGVTSVCEPCAYLASGGHLIGSKMINEGITIAFGRKI